LDAAFEEKEIRKSNLILEAHFLREQQYFQDAADRFAQAARIEERLSKELERLGLQEKFLVHRFSALSCWGQAGNLHRAIKMADELLARPDLPASYRERVRKYRETLRARQAEWLAAQGEREAPEAVAV